MAVEGVWGYEEGDKRRQEERSHKCRYTKRGHFSSGSIVKWLKKGFTWLVSRP